MSDNILKALMQLFAIIANADRLTENGRNIVESFLKQQLSQFHVNKYLAVFDEYFSFLQGKADPDKMRKQVSVNSVKVLRICANINSELNLRQKYIVLIRLIEFAYSSEGDISELEYDFLTTVANSFNINDEEFKNCITIGAHHTSVVITDDDAFLLIDHKTESVLQKALHLHNESLQGELWFLNIKHAGIIFVRYFGDSPLLLNGQRIYKDTVYVFTQGSVIRGPKLHPVYYSDVMRCFWEGTILDNLHFYVHDLEYEFKGGNKGLRNINFVAESGNLIGIMGGSGAGKSTLLNVLNTNMKPSQGEVLVNGMNLHTQRKQLEGVIGYVPQDDLLMEDLTVFQNLFFNCKLCFGDKDDTFIERKVNDILHVLGLFESRNLKVGGVLDKTISGGQRKRLNIALELAREPAILFIDEPTSGLSSRDSENVMDLLKQLSISGKLIFVVIHQPSSGIFKLFDKLMLLDKGGYPVYFGNPSDSLLYFKSKAQYADADEGECVVCGNINPEEIFTIIESKVLDEFGNPTKERKITPEEWNDFYRHDFQAKEISEHTNDKIPKGGFKKPNVFKQFLVFIQRDVLSKISNTQYLFINLLEAPVLALILSFFLKYNKQGEGYMFRENSNLPAFIFISVIVSIFLGLMVSAEEIIRDRKILKREAFLNLSRGSYLFSKISIMFFLSAIQTLMYVLIANSIFGIHEMYASYWLILFSASCFSNMLGLNVSSAFDSAITIYILIPFLIIPQIILSGVIVKFENLNPVITNQEKVPLIGDAMVSRWAFEALAVNQFKNNSYEKIFFKYDEQISNASLRKDFWLMHLRDELERWKNKNSEAAKLSGDQETRNKLLHHEIAGELERNPNVKMESPALEKTVDYNESLYTMRKKYLDDLRNFYISQYNTAQEKRNKLLDYYHEPSHVQWIKETEDNCSNEELEYLVKNDRELNQVVQYKGRFVLRYQPVYQKSERHSNVRAPLFVSQKCAFGNYYETFSINVIIIWLMTVFLAIALYFDWLRKLIETTGALFGRMKVRKRG